MSFSPRFSLVVGMTLTCLVTQGNGLVPLQYAQCRRFNGNRLLRPLQVSPMQYAQLQSTGLSLSASDNNDNDGTRQLPFYLDPGTKGGALFLSLVAFVIPIIFYEIVTTVFGFDGIEAGKWIGGLFTVFATIAWVGTYIFRVATKDMTYAKQLKDYENAVIAKRLEELDEDELQALVEEVERDEF